VTTSTVEPWRQSSIGRYICRLLLEAGITVNGDAPWDIQVHNRAVFRRVLLGGTIGLGESYVDGWWDCDDLRGFFERLIRWRNGRRRAPLVEWQRVLLNLTRCVHNRQNLRRARRVADAHYDLPACLFEAMLGSTMAYSCGYWPGVATLGDAQRNKMDLICRKLRIRPSDRVLDLGCGFGSFARFAAERYGCSVVGVTNSTSHARFARDLCQGLPAEIHECDYRAVRDYTNGSRFDKVVSIAMCEAIGAANYRTYMEIVDEVLVENGLWLLHTLGDRACSSDPWMNKHIFPNGELPTQPQLAKAMRGLFTVEDFHCFQSDYCQTVEAWEANFIGQWQMLRSRNEALFNDRFFRMWTYYLRSCWGSLRAGNMQLWQIVMSKPGFAGGYEAVR
jgi:cyclopropane-fatty-acyl-phospholipid synthase